MKLIPQLLQNIKQNYFIILFLLSCLDSGNLQTILEITFVCFNLRNKEEGVMKELSTCVCSIGNFRYVSWSSSSSKYQLFSLLQFGFRNKKIMCFSLPNSLQNCVPKYLSYIRFVLFNDICICLDFFYQIQRENIDMEVTQ